jgi:outer membrane immunogenic protein
MQAEFRRLGLRETKGMPKMRLKLLAVAIAVLTVGGSAFAADLPSRVEPPIYIPPPSLLTWTGFYIGGNAGYGWNTGGGNEFCIGPTGVLGDPDCQVLPPGVSGTSVGRGALVGGQFGYNWQSGSVVYGLETDFDAAFIRSSTAVNGPFALAGLPGIATPPGIFTSSLRVESLGTVRGRLGYALVDRLLVYATGGLVYGEVEANSLLTSPGSATIYPGATSKFSVGWTLGGGVDYALTANWSVKAEGLYYDLGKVTTIGSEVPLAFLPSGFQHNESFKTDGVIVRVGLDYKLDWFAPPPVPIVAKY